MKFEAEWAKGRENMLQTRDLGQTNGLMDGWADGQTNHYKAPAEQGLNYLCK